MMMAQLSPGPGAVVLVGASGSGKSVVGRRAAEETGWTLCDTDLHILEQTGYQRIADVFGKLGESHFRALERKWLAGAQEGADRLVIATGGGLPAGPGAMDELMKVGTTIYLKASVDELWTRLIYEPRGLADRPLLMSGGQDALARLVEEREPIYSRSPVVLDTDQLSVDEVCAHVVAQIELQAGMRSNQGGP